MDDFIGGGGYNSGRQTQDQANAKKWMKIVGIILGLLLVAAIGLICLMYYIQTTELKITVDGKSNTKLKNVFIFEGDQIYIPIRVFASYVGYESYSGDYKQYEEDTTKCYVQSQNEVASFSLGSNKIYKTLLDNNNNNYEYFEINEPVKIIQNQLCTTIEGAQIAFNISMGYNKEHNQITVYTLPYLVAHYTALSQNSGIADKDADFSNQKALLYNMLVVKNANGNYGVQSLNGQEILGTKYAKVKFIESTKEFIVTTLENKMGIMSYNATTKISPEYDNIKQIDKDNGLYLVTKNKKQGVVNSNGSIVIYLEYDQIGIDGTKYASNNIKNQYLLYEKCIPVKKNNIWELFDKTGKKITKEQYDDLGCSAGSTNLNDKNTNNILLVPKYEGIVVKKKEMYGLIDADGKQLLPIALQSIYSTISAGDETYHMIYNDQEMNVITYIETYVRPKQQENNPQTENTENTQNNTENTNQTNQQTNNENTANQNSNTNTNATQNTTNPTNNNQNVQQ